MNAGVLAIGTEITDGEIVNGNAAWLAAESEKLGFRTVVHVSVPDATSDILSALHYMAEHPVLFLTGGLGPTSDDITRQVVAEWIGEPLIFFDDLWEAFVASCERRGLVVRPAHRQQFYFPRNSQILMNPVGTAHGFFVQHNNQSVFVFPGPPAEVSGMWTESALPILSDLAPSNNLIRLVWRTFGAPESEIAEVVEKAIAKSDLTVGYRATVPYVIVKLWVPNDDVNKWQKKMAEVLKPWLILEGEGDTLHLLLDKLSEFKRIRILDGVTAGKLGARFEKALKFKKKWRSQEIELVSLLGAIRSDENYREPADANYSVVIEDGTNRYRVSALIDSRAHSQTRELPYKLKVNQERGRIYICEDAIRLWLEFSS